MKINTHDLIHKSWKRIPVWNKQWLVSCWELTATSDLVRCSPDIDLLSNRVEVMNSTLKYKLLQWSFESNASSPWDPSSLYFFSAKRTSDSFVLQILTCSQCTPHDMTSDFNILLLHLFPFHLMVSLHFTKFLSRDHRSKCKEHIRNSRQEWVVEETNINVIYRDRDESVGVTVFPCDPVP